MSYRKFRLTKTIETDVTVFKEEIAEESLNDPEVWRQTAAEKCKFDEDSSKTTIKITRIE